MAAYCSLVGILYNVFTRVECFTSKMTFLTTLQLKIVK